MSEDKFLGRFLLGLALGAGLILGALLGFAILRAVESVFWPITTDWKAASVVIDGDDIIVKGSMIKRRECDYIQPPRAREATTNDQFQVISSAPTAGLSWAADLAPQPFGPWRVKDGARKHLEFYLIYRCHSFWTTTTILGEITP